MLQIPRWKIYLSILISLLAIVYSLPTFISKNSILQNILPEQKINLGLDLKGGASILLELKFDDYEKQQHEKFLNELKSYAKSNKCFTISQKDEVILKCDDKNLMITDIKKNYGNQYNLQIKNDEIILSKNLDLIEQDRARLMNQTIEIIRRRVDELGTKEIDLHQQSQNYILLQIPGVNDPSEVKQLLGKTAKLGFHLVEQNYNINEFKSGIKVLPYEETKEGRIYNIAVHTIPILTGEMLINAQTSIQNNNVAVTFQLNQIGTRLFANASTTYVGHAFAIVLDDIVMSAPIIREPILNGSGQITGNFTLTSANELALLLRAGALPVSLEVVEERSVGPSLGLDSIEAGIKSAVVGGFLVLAFMFIFYYWFGMVANIALFLNLILMIAILAIFNATLTMPGIAGIVLTLGMAVDANVLIFERIREELSKGKNSLAAIDKGYKMAYNTIFDSNLTTVLVGVILYIFGVGPIKGFAVTLIVGILCSMFTAVTITKIIIVFAVRRFKPKVIIV